jgi:antibiotic biosynthesis monooxygenase (ABM) superfamily enzyme
MEQQFERALREFVRESLHLPGTTGVHLVCPIPGVDGHEFGILRSFESETARKAFYASEMFAKWEETAAPMVIGAPTERQLHGLEAFFRGSGKAPPRWKMAIVTWIGVFPAVLFWSTLLPAPLSGFHPLLVSAIVDVFVVVTLAWGLMPLLTKVFSNWLLANS